MTNHTQEALERFDKQAREKHGSEVWATAEVRALLEQELEALEERVRSENRLNNIKAKMGDELFDYLNEKDPDLIVEIMEYLANNKSLTNKGEG